MSIYSIAGMYRLGFTETTLLFFYYMDFHHEAGSGSMSGVYKDLQANMIQWLYTTGGCYDESIPGSYFDMDATACHRSSMYNEYMKQLLEKIKAYPGGCMLNFHQMHPSLQPYQHQFIAYLGKQTTWGSYVHRHLMMAFFREKKRILIVNDIASLFVQQYETGKVQKIYPDFPSLDCFVCYNPGTTFFNQGPHGTFLCSTEHHCQRLSDIMDQHDIQGVIVCAGAYTVLLADFIHRVKQKEVLCPGGGVSEYFGVLIGRTRRFHPDWRTRLPCPDAWIPVPDALKPPDCEKIEDCAYW